MCELLFHTTQVKNAERSGSETAEYCKEDAVELLGLEDREEELVVATSIVVNVAGCMG
jgi:hypothetical protein